MATQKISEMTAASSVADADLVPVVQGGANKKATVDLILDGLTGARVTTALGYTAANNASLANYLALAGGTMTGALVLAGAPTIDLHAATKLYVDGLIAGKQPLDATLTALAALGAGPGFLQVTGQDTFSIAALTDTQINTALGYTAADAAALNASNLTSGTLPDARFPATLPAASGANLTALNASNLASGTVGTARLGSGTANSGTYLRGDSTWAAISAGVDGSGSAGVVAVWSDTDTLTDSKMTTSGTNGGTWTLYDSTGGSGETQLVIRQGVVTTSKLFQIWRPDGVSSIFSVDDTGGGARVEVGPAGQYRTTASFLSASELRGSSTWTIAWSPGSVYDGRDLGLARSAAGILKVTDGATGFGRVQANGYGLDGNNGAQTNIKTISESITLATGGLTTDSTADLLPANSLILAVTARVTTTITTTTDWALGDATTATRFSDASATLTAGTTVVGVNHQKGGVSTDATGQTQTAAAKLRITCSGANPGAGVVRVTVTYLELTAPTS